MVRREDYQDGLSFHTRRFTEGIGTESVKPIEYTEHIQGMPTQPFMYLSIHESQQLMDELWKCGLRPTEGTGSAGPA